MTHDFCDWEPCELLKQFVKRFALPRRDPTTVQALVFKPGSDVFEEPMKITTFYYCPFCGTRMHNNREVLEWISEHGRKS